MIISITFDDSDVDVVAGYGENVILKVAQSVGYVPEQHGNYEEYVNDYFQNQIIEAILHSADQVDARVAQAIVEETSMAKMEVVKTKMKAKM